MVWTSKVRLWTSEVWVWISEVWVWISEVWVWISEVWVCGGGQEQDEDMETAPRATTQGGKRERLKLRR